MGLEKLRGCAQPMAKERTQDASGPEEGCLLRTVHYGAWHVSNSEALRLFLNIWRYRAKPSVLSSAQASARSGFVFLIRPEPTWLWARALCILAGKGLGAGGEVSGSEAPRHSVFRLLLLPEAGSSSSASFCPWFSTSVSLCETWISCFWPHWQLARIPVRSDGRRGLWEARCAVQMSIVP